MAYRLFLDDERLPPDNGEWLVARNFDEATEIMIRLGCPVYMSFDHDLGLNNDGSEKNGKHVAEWMVERHLDYGNFFPDNFNFYVHSQNNVGAANIRGYLSNFFSAYFGVKPPDV